ncbi:probable RNA-binding protein CG14230 [Drosophila sulfurigaster albostrigata]|uniref:probable RNA-binding protein CG14230 n=1 Tax=Drosophila sulfurigaster albostrigata TaxID=89887 RepID=UPI002D21D0CA|nr:probable RNA-binding protein CG14230 [Drosophila sulfurigaster albostrigata]
MGSTRFFLADLASRTTEQDLRSLFQDYGHVERVELKTKEQIIDAGETVTKVIAFVTVQTDDAHYCLNELNWQKLHGYKLKVSLAKESFLDRLKRERDEGQQDGQQQTDAHNDYQSSSRLLAQNTQNKRRVFGEHEEINDDEVPIELLITKKRAANSMHNGKIVIQQEQDVKPLHVIEQHKKPAKQKKANLDAKATIADQKRKESLNKMQQQHQQKKSAIQIALSSEAGQAKRIKFSDAEEDDDEEEQQKQKKQTKMDLFDDDDEEEEDAEGFQLPQHSGKKGERLVEMQSKQSLDPRFRITSNFVADDENDEDENEHEDEEQHEPQSGQEVSERNWQMGILEQVIGRKIDTSKSDPSKASKNKKMLRFDPAKEDHQKLLRTKPKKPEVVRQQSTDEAVEESATNGTAPVSQSAFYVVTDTLKESLKMRGEGFSLLDMFGSSHEEAAAERQDQLEKLGHEKILVNSKANSSKLGLQSANPFSYDSSDSEEDDEVTEEPATASKENEAPVVKQKQKKQQIQLESFFIPKNDVRLKEGAKFFKSSKPELENENYDEVKKRLKLLITKKIAKTQKAMPGSKPAKKGKNKK